MNPVFSFLVANYNNRPYAGELLDSLINQTFTSWEAIIVDDASTDGGIADIVATRNDTRIKYIALQENRGAAHAWNTGFRHSSGSLFPVIGADDFFSKDYLEKMNVFFKEHPHTSIAYVDYVHFGTQNSIFRYTHKSVEDLTHEQWIPHGGACVTREVMVKSGGYYEGPELRHGNIDWDFWLSVAEAGLFSPERIPEPLYHYRIHGNNMSKGRWRYEYITRECMFGRHKKFFDKYGGGPDFLASGYFESAAGYWRAKKYDQAVNLATKGAEYSPLQPPQGLPQANPANLGKHIVALESRFNSMGAQAFEPGPENLDTRLQLAIAYSTLRQWEKAETNLMRALAMVVAQNESAQAADLAVLLSDLEAKAGKDDMARQACAIALLCNPFNLDALYLNFYESLKSSKKNKALQFFAPWLEVTNPAALKTAAPYFSLLSALPGKDLQWIQTRLTEIKPPPRKEAESLGELIWSVPLGKRLFWEYRSKDLYERYGDSQEGFDSLRKAIALAHARTVLEVGCGNGRNLVLFSRMGLSSVGQDISSAAIALSEQRHLPGVKLYLCPLKELEFPENHFDLVVCNRVLQHLGQNELESTLEEICRLGKFVYINESLPQDKYAESWYLKKYDLVEMLKKLGMSQVPDFSDEELKNAMLFTRENKNEV